MSDSEYETDCTESISTTIDDSIAESEDSDDDTCSTDIDFDTSSSDSVSSSESLSSHSTDTDSSSSSESETESDNEQLDTELDDDEKVKHELQFRSKYYHTQHHRRHNKIQTLISSFCLSIIKQTKKTKLIHIIPLGIKQIIFNFHGYHDEFFIGIGQCGTQMMSSSTCNYSSKTLYIDSQVIPPNDILNSNNCIIPPMDIINSNTSIHGQAGFGNNWAKGYYGDGAQFMNIHINRIRREIEKYDSLQSIEFVHSIGGATGSGTGCFLMENIKDLFDTLVLSSFTVFPSNKVSWVVVEPYNAVLTLHKFEDCIDNIFALDNEKLHTLALRTCKRRRTPTYERLNEIANNGINNTRAIWKYSDWNIHDIGCELKKYSERLKYFVISTVSPSTEHVYGLDYAWTDVFDSKNCLASIDEENGKYLSTICSINSDEKLRIEPLMNKLLKHEARLSLSGKIHDKCYVNPTFMNVREGVCEESVTMIGSHCGITKIFDRLLMQFRKMYKRKAFLHWYKEIGMIEEEFVEAEENLVSLIDEYQEFNFI